MEMAPGTGGPPEVGRRSFLAAGVATLGVGSVAGCTGNNPDTDLTIYSGRSEHQIEPIFRAVETELGIEIGDRYGDSAGMAGQIVEEGEQTPADLFYTQDSGTLGMLKQAGRTRSLPDSVLSTVPEPYRDPAGTWTGVSGRTRCVAYNTETWSAGALPDDIFAYAADERFHGELGWRIDSGSFLSFIRAMMIEYGESRTREWLEDLLGLEIRGYEGGSTTPRAVANGEVTVGFVNHYYVGRLLEEDPSATIDITFTDGDVGSLFNVSGTAIIDTSERYEMAADFVETVLSPQIQEMFVELNAEYPVIPAVEYMGDLPQLDEINPPDFDLNELADVEPAQDLLRDVGIL